MDSNAHLDEYIDFQKYWLVLKRRWIPAAAIFGGVVGLSILYALSLAPVYQAEARLLIKADRSAKLTGLENGTGEIEGLTTDSNPLATEAQIIQSRPIVDKLIEELNLKDDEGEPLKYKKFAEKLKATPVTGTDLLEITYSNEDPKLAANIVNKAIELYIEDHTLNNRSETASARKFIERQLPQVETRVREAEENLRRFKNQNGIASLDEETTANIGSLSMVANQVDEIEAELENVNARYERLQSQLNMSWQEASAVSSLSESLAVQRVLAQLQEVKVALVQERNYLSDLAPQVIALKEEEADLTALLDRQIANTLGSEQQALVDNVNILGLGELKQAQIAEFANLGLKKEGLEKKLRNLKNTYDSYQQKSDTLPSLQERQRELMRRVEASQSTYQTLLSKLQETQISEEQNIGNVRVVSEAVVPDEPAGPNKILIVAGAGIFGALLGAAVAFLLDIKDRTIKNTHEIELMLPYPLYGIVPDHNKIAAKKQFLLPDSSFQNTPLLTTSNFSVLPIEEAYHNIQVNLELLDSNIASKVIVVTSATSGEGKSSVSANLAKAKAQCGEKVLLIDGDLRRPMQHRIWGISNNNGLTEILKQQVEWEETIQNVMPNLDAIASGLIPEHSVSLLNSPLMKELIVSAVGYYDRIILDTPPLIGLADTKILGKLADSMLFVVRPGVASYGSIAAAKKAVETSNLNVLGIIANSVDLDREPYGYEVYYPNKRYLEAAS
ncbi:polysaccharide biosynthesis tyrosine autokinase [Myxosarcina sp. GI1]|uniref:GumC family protein n=1 Tax=Myxosarcina sp. GI1 TaxID=1541065 RepID=UPI0005654FC0|nr:polysaccharide biosynthesis tyrosine autokinase [Myxosarcina sp. GI1]